MDSFDFARVEVEATGGAMRGSSSSAEKEKAGFEMIFFAGREPIVVFLSPNESLMGGVDILS